MKIKITENQLKNIVEKLQSSESINEAWYDDAWEFVKSSYETIKGKSKEIFKDITGVDYGKKDEVKGDDIPTEKEIDKNINKFEKKMDQDSPESNGDLKNIIIGDSTVPYLDNAVQKASRINKKGGESSLWLGGMSVIWLIGALKKYPVNKNVKNVIISMGTNGGFGKYLKYDVGELFSLLRKKFPNAKFIVVQGAWGFGTLKNIKDDDVKKYYQKYKNEGATVIEPPIGRNEPHGNIPIYQKIAREIDGML